MPSSTPADQEIIYLDIGSIPETGRISERLESYRFGEAPSRARRVVQDGDVIVSTVRPYLRAFARIQDPPPNLIASTGFAVLTPRDGVDSEFLFQTVCSRRFVAQLEARMVGSNYPAVNNGDVADSILLLPPLREQSKIAAILSSVDEAIATARKVIEQTKRLRQGLLQDLMTRGIGHTRFKKTEVGDIPAEWEVVQIKHAGDVVTGSTPSTSEESYWDGSLPFVTPGEIQEDTPVLEATERHLTITGAEKGRKVPAGSVLMVCIGSSIGKVGVSTEEVAFNQQINAIVPRPRDEWYLYGACSRLMPLMRQVTGRQAVPIVNKTAFSTLLIPWPSADERRRIGRVLERIEESVGADVATVSQLESLKRGLMQDLLTGRVRVQPA